MSTKFDYAYFLEQMEILGDHICIDEVIYSWNGNYWQTLTDKRGEAFVLDWLRTNARTNVSTATVKQAWGAFKLDLLNKEVKRNKRQIIIPCEGTYVLMDEKGNISITAPEKNYYCSHALACAYDPTAARPMFDAFLEKVLPDEVVRARVQEYVGYTLLSDSRFQRAALWLGSGANGKGVLSNIIQALHARVQSIQLDSTSRFALSSAFSASLLVADELPARKLDEAKLKTLIAGEPLFIDIKMQAPITTHVTAKLLVLGNNFPVVDDSSEGFWRRWDIVPFDVTIPEGERDPRLAERIKEHEMAGVLNWALEGLQRLLKREGFEVEAPESMKRALSKAKSVTNDVTGWLSQRVASVSGAPALPKSTVYSDYCRWCMANDFQPQSPQGFWLKLKRQRTDLTDKKARFGDRTSYVCSIVLKPEPIDAYKAAA